MEAVEEGPEQDGEKGNELGERALGKEAEADGGPQQVEPGVRETLREGACRIAVLELPEGPHGEDQEENERHVGHRHAGVDEDLQAGEPAGAGEKGAQVVAAQPTGEAKDEKGAKEGTGRGMEAGRELIDSEDPKVEAHPPVGERRLVEAVFVVEVGDDPLAAIHHFDGGVGEAGFVAVDERQRVEPGQEHDRGEDDQAEAGEAGDGGCEIQGWEVRGWKSGVPSSPGVGAVVRGGQVASVGGWWW